MSAPLEFSSSRNAFGGLAPSMRMAAAAAALVGLALPAAADPANLWQGFYVGANAGYGYSEDLDSDIRLNPAPGIFGPFSGASYPINRNAPEGGFGGVQVGYNQQYGSFVVGVEADIQKSDLSDRAQVTGTLPNPTNVYETNADLEWFGTVRLRGGVAIDRALLYVTGGLAFGEFDYRGVISDPIVVNTVTFETSGVETGWVIGGGVEYALGINWTVKGEYQYIDLGDETITAPYVPATGRDFDMDLDTTIHTFRVGVNYILPN